MKLPATTQKLRGGYYTPQVIAHFLADWAIDGPETTVLEPSFGDGNILQSIVDVLREKGTPDIKLQQAIHGVEIIEDEARKAKDRLGSMGLKSLKNLHVGDFFSYCQDQLMYQARFDAVIGNPPFIRYQHFQESQRTIAFQLMAQAGLRPTRLTNTWVPFLVTATLLLKEHGGRVAMVIPAELLQVNYAAELRQFLTDQYSKITLVTFRKLLFDGIQQEVVLFLGEKNGDDRTGIRTIELDSINDLPRYEHTTFSIDELKPMDHSKEKWTQYFLDHCEIELMRKLRNHSGITESRKVIDVDVGVVTGLNDFFILTESQATELGLIEYTKPIVTRSGHLQGINFDSSDLSGNVLKQLPTYILDAPNVPREKLPKTVKQYIAHGEENDYHTGYKCRIRDRWYIVPSVWTPQAFMLRQIHGYPKLILNQTDATCTDTIHRVRFVSSIPGRIITSAFINSLTFAFTEVVGRSYGGGVLELEPNEAEALPLPLKFAEQLDFETINDLVIQGKIEEALNITDRTLLVDGLGLSIEEVEQIRGIWRKLRDRRIYRKHKKADAVV